MSLDLAHRSLVGLSLGDAFGELFFRHRLTPATPLPPGPWSWTDDTHMALSIVEVLGRHGRIDCDALARTFATHFMAQPLRGYGPGAFSLLTELARRRDWRAAAPAMFGGAGSFGNGAAMRAAPIGGFHAGDLAAAVENAHASARVTHAHPEGAAGAVAVAAAAALTAGGDAPAGAEFVRAVARHVPASEVAQRLGQAAEIPADQADHAARILGTGLRVSAQDTAPWCVWVAAHHLGRYEDALWCTALRGGDVDTTCAIVGGIVALSDTVLPPHWLERREPLPALARPGPGAR